MAYINCENVSFAYENQVVVSDLNFQVNEGDYLCIIGENGSGKTTLLKGLLGLKKPFQGQIILGDGLKPTQIGYVPQQTEAQRDFPASLWEVVLSGCLNRRGIRPGFSKEDKARAEKNMELMGISDLRKRSFRELSGGQRQRALLARSLCATEKILLLDEPTTGLDPVAIEEFYRLMQELNQKHDITILMVSHAIREAVEHASHILHLSQGSYFFGTVKEYEESDAGKYFMGGESHG